VVAYSERVRAIVGKNGVIRGAIVVIAGANGRFMSQKRLLRVMIGLVWL
jgi:hypothetical protein